MHRNGVIATGLAGLAVVGGLAGTLAGVDRAQGEKAAVAQAVTTPAGTQELGQGPGPASAAVSGPTGRTALVGPWTLRRDPKGRGLDNGWRKGTFKGASIQLPYVPNAKNIAGKAALPSYRGGIAWYATKLTVRQAGTYALHFGSINHRARIYLDGREIGRHIGEFLPFELNARLAPGKAHRLVVRADWRFPSRMKREAWHRTWFNFGGINREITIRRLGNSALSNPTVRTRLQADGSALVDVSVLVRNRTSTRAVGVTAAMTGKDGTSVPLTFPTLTLQAGSERRVRTTISVPDPKLWAPGSPNLYDISFSVGEESGYLVRTGLRQVSRDGRRLLLNGKQMLLRGASIHEDVRGRGDALRPQDMDSLVSDLQAIGATSTRAQHPLSPALLERLDAAGIMVWQGVGVVDAPGAWTSKTPALRAQSRGRVLTTLAEAQTNPSIIVWNLANEVAGNGHPGGQPKWIDGMAQELKRRDPSRLVGLDVWGTHPPKKAGFMYRNIDAIGDTNYIGWYERTRDPRASVKQAIRNHIAAFKRIFRGKILVVTEFGAEANSGNPTNKPGGFRFQADLLRDHIDVYRSISDVSGMLVWNLRDFGVNPEFAGGSIRRQIPEIVLVRGVNQKGLFTYGGSPKLSVGVVREALGRAAASAASKGIG